jgi:prolyl 4-hydroxylase
MQQLEFRARSGEVGAQIEFGLRLEAGGQPYAGLDWLALAARSGDPRALGLVGMRLVTGRFGPDVARRGTGLLAEAAEAGSADAAAQLAVLRAMGMHLEKDWDVALDHLQQAAESGRRQARIELAILAGDPEDPTGDSPSRWARLRKRIDIAALTAPGAGAPLAEGPRVHWFEAFASDAACAWIIEQASPRLRRAEVYDPDGSGTRTSAMRNNRAAAFGLLETNLVLLALQEKVAAAAGAGLEMMEGGSVLCYAPGEEAGEHFDFLDPALPAQAEEITQGGQRIATCLVYLNEGYAGGATEFPHLGLSCKGRRGGALLFRNTDDLGSPDPRSLHAGRTPRDGDKWVLSCFIRDRRRYG